MEEPNGHVCPQCGAPRAADNSPSCACARRTADALRDTRTAEAAAAEDFGPLRIRPYVDFEGGEAGGAGTGGSRGAAESGAAAGTDGVAGAAGTDRTAAGPVGAGGAAVTGVPGPAPARPGVAADAAETRPVPAVELTMPLREAAPPPGGAAPSAPRAGEPGPVGLSLFDSAHDGPPTAATPWPADGGPKDAPRRRRRRPAALLAVSAAAVVVVAAAGYASGLFSYESPARDDASAHEVRESIPDVPPSTAPSSAPAAPVAPSAPSASPSASPSPSTSPSPSRSASPSATASPSPSASTSPTGTRPTAPTPSGTTGKPSAPAQLGPVLQRGDHGSEVAELQSRLAKLYLYTGPVNGDYDRRVEDSVRVYQWSRGTTSDGLGVYGPATRASLESET